MNDGVNGVALGVFIFFFLAVTVMGFLAARWRKAENALHLDEWGLGGRSASAPGSPGSCSAATSTPRTPSSPCRRRSTRRARPASSRCRTRSSSTRWSSCSCRGCGRSRTSTATSTTSDFVRGRFGSKGLSLAVARHRHPGHHAVHRAPTGRHPGRTGRDGRRRRRDTNWFVKDLPLLIAFGVLAAYTYSSGLRAPALIAFVKDALIYIVIAVAIIYIPIQAGRLRRHLRKAGDAYAVTNPATGKPRGVAGDRGRRRSGRTPRWRWARRWRCSCTRTR